MNKTTTFLIGIGVGAILIFALFEPAPELPMLENTILLTWSEDMEEANRISQEIFGTDVIGLAGYNLETGVCTIYAPMPKGEDDKDAMETLGHETLHCFVGNFHE